MKKGQTGVEFVVLAVFAAALLGGLIVTKAPDILFGKAPAPAQSFLPFEVGTQSGFTTLACDSVSVESSNEFLSGQVLKCSGVVGGGEEVKILLSAPAGYILPKQAIISAKVDKQICLYQVERIGLQLLDMIQDTVQTGGYMNCGQYTCYYVTSTIHSGSPLYEVGQIPAVPQSVDFSISVSITDTDGNFLGAGVLNNSNTANYLYDANGNKIAYAKWAGNLGSLSQCSTTQQYFVRSTTSNQSKWIPISTVNYNAWVAAQGTTYSCSYWVNDPKGTSCTFPSFANYPQFTFVQGMKDKLKVATNYLTSDNYYISPSAPIIAPLVVTWVKGDLLGLRVPVGAPHFVSVSTKKVVASVPTDTIVTLKNDGTEKDCFDFSLFCASKPSISLFANKMCLNANETATGILTVSGLDGQVDCKLSAFSVGNPDNKESIDVTYTIFKPPCPSTAQCCALDSIYEAKGCEPKPYYEIKGTSGGVRSVAEVGYKIYSCQNFACSEVGSCSVKDLSKQYGDCTQYGVGQGSTSCPSGVQPISCSGIETLKSFEVPLWYSQNNPQLGIDLASGANLAVLPTAIPTAIFSSELLPPPSQIPQAPQDNTGTYVLIGGAAVILLGLGAFAYAKGWLG